jgi:superfamily II DNA/RNA helicase
MLDMGFIDEVNRIASLTPEDRQTLLFSATLEGEIEKVARRLLKHPKQVQVAGVQEKHESITQQLHQADDYRHKRSLLAHILDRDDTRQVIVFTATKKGAEDLASKLADAGHQCAALHGDMRQSMRRRTVESLRRRKLKVLVATDVAARGLDIQGITHVVNFDMPMQAEDYVHRIGRTGRGGSTGTAISLIGPQDWMQLSRIEKLLDAKLELTEIPGLEPKQARPRMQHKNSAGNRRKPNIRFKRGSRRGNDGRQQQGRHQVQRNNRNAETA